MKTTAFIFILLLVTVAASGTVTAEEVTHIYPGMEGAPVEVLTNMYPTVKTNSTIMGYIRDCGVGSWHEEQLNKDLKSAHLAPANSCGKQLVFSIRKSAGRDDPARITDIWIIGINKTWSSSMNTVYASAVTSPVPLHMDSAGKAMDIIVMGIVVALALIGIAYVLIQRRNQ